MAGVRIWQKKQLRLDLLTVRQRDMVQIGAVGLLSVMRRLSQAKGPTDAAAKPLRKGYAIYKSKMRKGNRRNLWLTGDMLRNLKLRTVTDNEAKAALTSRKQREKGRFNERIEPWLVFSPTNRDAVMAKAREVFARICAALPRGD
jgi:hypothetical protein